jgi:hypothetical protein
MASGLVERFQNSNHLRRLETSPFSDSKAQRPNEQFHGIGRLVITAEPPSGAAQSEDCRPLMQLRPRQRRSVICRMPVAPFRSREIDRISTHNASRTACRGRCAGRGTDGQSRAVVAAMCRTIPNAVMPNAMAAKGKRTSTAAPTALRRPCQVSNSPDVQSRNEVRSPRVASAS